MAVTTDTSAPYTPPGQIIEIVRRFRDRGNPRPFNAEALARIGVPESLNARTMQALKVLDLIDERGEPTQTFEGIRLAPQSDYQKALQEWLKAAYADVFSIVEPSTDDETKVRDAFRSYSPAGQQGRMVSLFLGLCEEAGIRQKGEKKETASRQPRKKQVVRAQRTKQQHKPSQTNAAINEIGLPAALSGLLQSLPSNGQGWSQDRRNKFVDTFGTVLDFCYPISGHDEPEESEEDED